MSVMRMRRQRRMNQRRQSGYFLMEALIAIVVVGSMALIMTRLFNQQAENLTVERQAQWMSQYLNAIAGYMAQQGPIAPTPLTQTGTDWLKPVSCGGTFPDGDAYLPCNVPTNFHQPYGLPVPTVTFDYTSGPSADVNFGIVRKKPENIPDPRLASKLSSFIANDSEAAGYQHINVFHALPDNSDITSGNLRANIDSQLAADQHLRIDGTNEMTGPLITQHGEWAMIARDQNGDENADPTRKESSINVNDGFIRSSGTGGYWLSETHAIAEEALRLASRSVRGMTEVGSGTTVDKPSCTGGMVPQLFVGPVSFLGGVEADPKFIAGVRKQVSDLGGAWQVTIEAVYEGVATWTTVGPNEGRALAISRCVN